MLCKSLWIRESAKCL
uniref:Uncharacterized protein n=1 Tax=Anguilla anguilla TaxID=7936 RepID=A0A0E9QD43_ANGAN